MNRYLRIELRGGLRKDDAHNYKNGDGQWYDQGEQSPIVAPICHPRQKSTAQCEG